MRGVFFNFNNLRIIHAPKIYSRLLEYDTQKTIIVTTIPNKKPPYSLIKKLV